MPRYRLTWTTVLDVTLLLIVFALQNVRGQMDQFDDSDSMGYSLPKSKIKTPQLTILDASCDASGMQVTVQFDSFFSGIIYSKGSYYTQGCIFVKQTTGQNAFSFSIPINACGTQSGNDDTKSPPVRYIENTIIMQNDAQYQQQTDVARRVRCNWNSNIRSTITFTPFRVDAGNVLAVNFNGNDVTTAMSVQVGRGPFAPVIAEGIVQIGDTLTLVIYLQTKDMTMDLQVLDCFASDGRSRNRIQLTDENGCVLKEKLITPWQTTRETQNTAAQIAYAYLTAFKFPDDMTVNIKCNIAVCKGGCVQKQCQGVKYGEVPPAPQVPEESRQLQRRTTRPAPPIIVPEDEGYGNPPPRIQTPLRTPRRTTTTTTTTTTTSTPQRRIINSYGIEEVETPEVPYMVSRLPPLVTRPPQRRRTVFDRKRRAAEDENRVEGQVPLVSSIRVISPSDLTSSNITRLRLSQQDPANLTTTCVNTALFGFLIALIIALLLSSCITSGLLCFRQRAISKKERELLEYDHPLPDYPQQ